MQLENVAPSGEQEWYCPTCQRRFLLQLTPDFKKTVLERGDEEASHSGGTGGLQIGGVTLNQKTESNPPLTAPDIEENIGGTEPVEISPALLKWLKDAGLDKLV
jgi:hypothetical protein